MAAIEKNTENSSASPSESDSAIIVAPGVLPPKKRREFLYFMVKSLPKAVQDRIVYLKNMQIEFTKMHASFIKDVYALKKKYQEKVEPLLEKRCEIIKGLNDPGKVKPLYNTKDSLFEGHGLGVSSGMKNELGKIPVDFEGIPFFWLTVFKQSQVLAEKIKPFDEPVLQYLMDVKVVYKDNKSYTLEFHFQKNRYFSNKVLTKKYFINFEPNQFMPFDYENEEIYMCEGCEIDWYPGMSVVEQPIKKYNIQSTLPSDYIEMKKMLSKSFFMFFNPPENQSLGLHPSALVNYVLAKDFEIGETLRSTIIPKAILFFTGEAEDDEDSDDYEDYDGEDESDFNEGDEDEDDKENTKKENLLNIHKK